MYAVGALYALTLLFNGRQEAWGLANISITITKTATSCTGTVVRN